MCLCVCVFVCVCTLSSSTDKVGHSQAQQFDITSCMSLHGAFASVQSRANEAKGLRRKPSKTLNCVPAKTALSKDPVASFPDNRKSKQPSFLHVCGMNLILLLPGSRRGNEGRTSRAVKVYGGHNLGSQGLGRWMHAGDGGCFTSCPL